MFDGESCFMNQVIKLAESKAHIMDFTVMRVLEAMFSLVRKGIDNVIEYNEDHPDFELENDQICNFIRKWVIFSTIWGIGGSMNLSARTEFSNELADLTDVDTPNCSV